MILSGYYLDVSVRTYSIPKAIQEYEKHTCLRFKERTTERGYIRFYKGNG